VLHNLGTVKVKIIYEQVFSKNDYPTYQLKVVNRINSVWYDNLKKYQSLGNDFIQRIFLIQNACFYGDWGYSNEYERKYINSIGWSNSLFDRCENQIKKTRPSGDKNPVVYEGTGVILSWPGVFTFGHWIYDVIPRLYMVHKNYHNIFDSSITFIIPHNLNKNLYEFFDLLKIKYLKLNFDNGVLVSNAIIPSLTSRILSYPFLFHKEAFQWYVNVIQIKSNLLMSGEKISNRCYVKHTTMTSKSNPRQITNEIDLINDLIKIDFSIYNPLNFDLTNQVSFFKNQKNIVGLDSSAMHNIVFSEIGSRQLVISGGDRTNFNHLCLSSLLDTSLYVYDTQCRPSEIKVESQFIRKWINNETT